MIHLHFHDAFKEGEHPRGEGGQFTSGGSGKKKKTGRARPEPGHLYAARVKAGRISAKEKEDIENSRKRGDDFRSVLRGTMTHEEFAKKWPESPAVTGKVEPEKYARYGQYGTRRPRHR